MERKEELKAWAKRRKAIYKRWLSGESARSISRDETINVSENRIRQIIAIEEKASKNA